jgi:hypothetical protein
VIIDGYGQHLHNLPPLDVAKALFRAPADTAAVQGFGSSELVCSVRGCEILFGFHPDYVPLPALFYAMLAELTGLELVFYGQINDDPYCNMLRAAFPNARFIPGRGTMPDFEVLRRSVNIVPSISTFAWLAAWLSDAQRIFLPVCGMFNPRQAPYHLFLPIGDPRYRFTLFPPTRAVNIFTEPDRFQERQKALAMGARMVASAELAGLVRRPLETRSIPASLWLRHQLLDLRSNLRLFFRPN